MKILFVINNYYVVGNGMCASARRTVHYLKEAGHEVRVLSGPNKQAAEPQPEFALKEYKFPFFQGIIEAQGFSYASSDPVVMEEAIRWADVIHLEEAFVLEIKALRIAQRLGKPVVATYHLHPENITNSLGFLRHWRWLNRTILRCWRDLVYNHCHFVQCPTQSVLERMQRYHVKAGLEVISNGLIPDRCIREPQMPADYESDTRPLKLIYIGRLSKEKDQTTLLEAMRYSAFSGRIQLIFAGIGPDAQRIKRHAHALYKQGVVAYEPQFVFLDRDGLRKLAAGADLCAHCATIEVEGLSIMEALQQAVVPVIAQGYHTGASQFALDDRSLFREGDPRDLSAKIDWWLSHPRERWEQGWRYVQSVEQYDITRSAAALIAQYEKAVAAGH